MAENNTDWQAEYNGKHALMNERGYEEVPPTAFYRYLFPEGSLQQENGDGSGKGNIIVTQIRPEHGKRSPQWVVGDNLQNIDKAIGDPFGLIAPVSYFGKSHTKSNAHELFAIVIDIDYVEVRHLKNLLYHFENYLQGQTHLTWQLAPTFLVSSGKGVHLYYLLQKPVPMYHEHERIYSELKKAFIRRLWNDTSSQRGEDKDKDIAGVTQGFRAVGSLSKLGEGFPVRAYRISENRYTLQQIHDAIPDCKVDLSGLQKETMPLSMARLLYPDWYKRRIEKNEQPRKQGEFVQDRRLYEWWKRKIQEETRSGGRYYSIMALCSFGLKCGVSDREIRRDARALLPLLESRTIDESNHFSAQDIEDALKALKKKNRDLTRKASRQWIEESTKADIPPQIRRNGRKRADHLELARAARDQNQRNNGTIWNGRKSKAAAVQEWRQKNPGGSKADCRRETGLAWDTIRKHWLQEERHGSERDLPTIGKIISFDEVQSLADVNRQIETLQGFLDTLTAAEQKTWYEQNRETVDELMNLLEEYTQE